MKWRSIRPIESPAGCGAAQPQRPCTRVGIKASQQASAAGQRQRVGWAGRASDAAVDAAPAKALRCIADCGKCKKTAHQRRQAGRQARRSVTHTGRAAGRQAQSPVRHCRLRGLQQRTAQQHGQAGRQARQSVTYTQGKADMHRQACKQAGSKPCAALQATGKGGAAAQATAQAGRRVVKRPTQGGRQAGRLEALCGFANLNKQWNSSAAQSRRPGMKAANTVRGRQPARP